MKEGDSKCGNGTTYNIQIISGFVGDIWSDYLNFYYMLNKTVLWKKAKKNPAVVEYEISLNFAKNRQFSFRKALTWKKKKDKVLRLKIKFTNSTAGDQGHIYSQPFSIFCNDNWG